MIGKILKKAIEIKDKLSQESEPIIDQETELKILLEKAKNTNFGTHYKFDQILKAQNVKRAFELAVPYFNYKQMYEQWWYLFKTGGQNLSWPDKPSYFALSSGTTGNTSKRLPVTDDMLDSIRKTGIKQLEAIAHFNLPASFFEKDILMVGSSTDLVEKDGHLEGEISGISASNIPNWFKGYYKPGEDIAQIKDWDEKVLRIAENAKDWDIGAISGIPSWIELMLKKVISYHNVKNIHEIWPNFQVYTSGGVAFDSYEKSFRALCGKDVIVMDTYLASEGFLAYQDRPETTAMKLATNNGIYFEFVPFVPEYINEDGSIAADAPSLSLSEVNENEDYVLVISTAAGLWRYSIGDTISFTDVKRAEIKITGRTKFFLNVVGSQLSVNKMNDAMSALENSFGIEIPEFTVAVGRNDDDTFYHHWFIGINGKFKKQTELAESIDAYLKESNKIYKVARSKALTQVKVEILEPDVFYKWNEKNKKKGGQVKMERVLKDDKYEKWMEFINEQLS